jgi:hypothetical protein
MRGHVLCMARRCVSRAREGPCKGRPTTMPGVGRIAASSRSSRPAVVAAWSAAVAVAGSCGLDGCAVSQAVGLRALGGPTAAVETTARLVGVKRILQAAPPARRALGARASHASAAVVDDLDRGARRPCRRRRTAGRAGRLGLPRLAIPSLWLVRRSVLDLGRRQSRLLRDRRGPQKRARRMVERS